MAQRIKLLEADDGNVLALCLFPMRFEFVIDFSSAKEDALDIVAWEREEGVASRRLTPLLEGVASGTRALLLEGVASWRLILLLRVSGMIR